MVLPPKPPGSSRRKYGTFEADIEKLLRPQDDSGYSTTERIPEISPVPRRRRLMSMENTSLTEVITVYEKLKKGRESRVYRQSNFADTVIQRSSEFNEAEETVPIVPTFHVQTDGISQLHVLDFNKFNKGFKHSKYLYFSNKANLLQADFIENLSPDFTELLKEKNYWLNIFDPNDHDFSMLFNCFGVHDLTISDIREGNTEEKMEPYKHYTFFSLRLENFQSLQGGEKRENEDVDFNILLFKDFIITIHDKKWPSITDILGFVNLLSAHSTVLTPDWVLFSCFTELSQDAKYVLDIIEPEINQIRICSKSADMSDNMRRNFAMELRLYSISRFIKPKMRILRQLRVKCSKRVSKTVLRLLGDILDEFREQSQDLNHFNHILERSQDTFLAVVTSDQSREANEMSLVMKRISEVALVFLPVQAIGSFFGMNCTVPWQSDQYPSQMYFWIICSICLLLGLTMYLLRTRILAVH